MEAYDVFKDLAIIIIFAKFFGIVARKCKAPQVVGEIVAHRRDYGGMVQWLTD